MMIIESDNGLLLRIHASIGMSDALAIADELEKASEGIAP
jgi:hypothetical protein